MTMLSCLDIIFEHNYTMRRPLLTAARRLKDDEFTKNMGVGRGSVRNILVHMMNTERYWSSVLSEQTSVYLDTDDFPSVGEIELKWQEIEQESREIIGNLENEDLHYVISVRWGDRTISFPILKALLHMAMHESHHRGVIIALLSQLGYDVPDVHMI